MAMLGHMKSLLMKMKEESEKAGFKLNIQKTKMIVSGPITSWQIERRKVEAVTDFLFLGSKITADGDCSHKIRRCLLFGRKAMTNLDSIWKSRDITLPTKVFIVKHSFSSSHYYKFVIADHKSAKEMMLLNWGAGGDSWESLGLKGEQISQS